MKPNSRKNPNSPKSYSDTGAAITEMRLLFAPIARRLHEGCLPHWSVVEAGAELSAWQTEDDTDVFEVRLRHPDFEYHGDYDANEKKFPWSGELLSGDLAKLRTWCFLAKVTFRIPDLF